jgi:hypothetical protein
MAALMRSRWVGLLILALCGANTVASQTVTPGPGSRIRFVRTAPLGSTRAAGDRSREITATVLEARRDSLLVAPTEGAPLAVALGEMEGVRLSGGKSRLAGGGAGVLWGVAVGGALGSLAGAVDAAGCDPPCERPRAEELGMLGALTSIWLGALIGFAVGRETWVPIKVSLNPSGAPASRASARLALSIPF